MDFQMNTNLRNKTVCFVDNGLFVDFARMCAPAFKKAYYAGLFGGTFPRSVELVVGKGFDDIERLTHPLDKADEIDLWCFLDVGYAPLQTFLAEHGARVWGARNGEEMELHRWEFKEHLRDIGLPVQPCWKIVGMDELRSFLKDKKDVFVKTSLVRGDFETFHAESYAIVEPRLDEIAHILGPRKDSYVFIVEDNIKDAVEVGYDGFCIDGRFPSHSMMAYEVKDKGMVGTVKSEDKLAEPVSLVNKKLISTLKSYSYRGFLSTEIRYDKNKSAFFIDPCCRLGTPSNELLQELFQGWPETLWYGAEGTVVSPKPIARFGALAILHSEWAVEHWLELEVPKEVEPYVKLRFHTRIDKKHYVPPQVVGIPDVGAVVGTGNSLTAAIKQCQERAERIRGFQLEVDLEALDEGVKVIAQGEKFGIRF